MSNVMAPEVSGLDPILVGADSWGIEHTRAPWRFAVTDVGVTSAYIDSQYGSTDLSGFLAEDRIYPFSRVMDMRSTGVQMEPMFSNDEVVYLSQHTGVGYTDPTDTSGGGSGGVRPEDGLLYPRGQG